jgi:hypothetical protein
MDGAMHKTVLIILVAVVALIVIVVLVGMRYLRADDEDDFDDNIQAERGQSRDRRDHLPRDHWRSRHHDDGNPDEDDRQRSRGDREVSPRGTVTRASRTSSSRGVADPDGLADPGPRSSGRTGTPGSQPSARRDGTVPGAERNSRSAAGQDAAARASTGRSPGWGRDDRSVRNPGPHRDRRSSGARDYEGRNYDNADSAEDLIPASTKPARGSTSRTGQRPDDTDDRTARAAARDNPRSSQDSRSAGTGRDERDRRGNTGPNARPDSRKNGTSQGRRDDESLPEVKPRASRSKRDDDGEWPSTEWDELSDVDYWAELASDKPLTTATPSVTPPARAERDRGDSRSDTDGGSRRSDRRDSRDTSERREQPLLPAARNSRQTVDAAFAPVTSVPADPGFSSRSDSYGSTGLRRAIASGSEPPRTASARASVTPISASTGLASTGLASTGPASTGPASTGSRPQPGDDDPLTSPSFPRITDDSRSYRRSRTETGSGSYPQAPDSQPASGGYARPARGAEYAAAPADPYGPQSQAPDIYAAGAGSNRYPSSAPAGGFLPPGGLGYQADAVTSAYSAPQPSSGGYHQELPSSASYARHDPAGFPASMPGQASYAHDTDSGGYATPAAAGYPAASQPSYPAEQQGYPGYPAVPALGESSGLPQPGTGFSYGQQPGPGYLGYQDPVDRAGLYPIPGDGFGVEAVQPGYPSAPYTANYEPAGYQAPVYEPDDGGYPADPYAVDPYGYPGYGAARLSDQPWPAHPSPAHPSPAHPSPAQRLPEDRPWPDQPWQETSWYGQEVSDEQDWADQPWDDLS